MKEEVVVYRTTCDACGDSEDLETDELPSGWEEFEGQTFCPMDAQG